MTDPGNGESRDDTDDRDARAEHAPEGQQASLGDDVPDVIDLDADFEAIRLKGTLPKAARVQDLYSSDLAKLTASQIRLPEFDVDRLIRGALLPAAEAISKHLDQQGVAAAEAVETLHSATRRAISNVAFSLPPLKVDVDGIQRALAHMQAQVRTALADAWEQVKPRNLRGLQIDVDLVQQIMADEGIPFFLVPDGDTALALLNADVYESRRALLASRHEAIFGACEPIIALCVERRLAFHGSTLREAIAAYRSGHRRAAQALATNVLDSVFQEYADETNRDVIVGKTTLKGGISGVRYVEGRAPREWFALMPLQKAHGQDHRTKPPQSMFTRNGTAHRVTPEQYTSANAVQAIMLATSLMGFAQGLW